MIAAEQIVNLYRARDAAKAREGGWAKWEEDHPQSSAALKSAMALVMDMEADDDGES